MGKENNLTTFQKKKECMSLSFLQKHCVAAHSLKSHVNIDDASLPISQK